MVQQLEDFVGPEQVGLAAALAVFPLVLFHLGDLIDTPRDPYSVARLSQSLLALSFFTYLYLIV